ncbi:MAG: cob(I)yrinic acid a,c-diamide adenosyltransferase [Bacteroidota bacterium]
MKGFIQVYTGNGKGKTTAALGLALRAFGAGKKVFIAQFVKGMSYSEIEAIHKFLPGISIVQFGLDCFIINTPTDKDLKAARFGLSEVSKIISSGDFDLVVLDEACIAIHYNLFTVDELLGLLKSKPESMEIVITGRYAPAELIEFSDLVTDMNEVKHYYKLGVEARKGIEF